MATELTPRRDGARHPSPPLVVLAAAHAALFAGSVVLTGLLTPGAHFPSAPDASAALAFSSRQAAAVRWSAFLQLGAAIPLGLFAATVSSRLHFLGVRAAGATIALAGGAGAAVLLAVSAAFQWALADPEVLASAASARVVHLVAFATGGPAFVLLFGILVAGVAVTGGLHRLLPRWMMISGLVLAAVAELSWLSLVLSSATLLLPLARFPGIAWLVAAGALLPARRRGAREALTPSTRRPDLAPPQTAEETP